MNLNALQCPKCGGTGIAPETYELGGYVPCGECKGTGFVPAAVRRQPEEVQTTSASRPRSLPVLVKVDEALKALLLKARRRWDRVPIGPIKTTDGYIFGEIVGLKKAIKALNMVRNEAPEGIVPALAQPDDQNQPSKS